jgi:NTP pyrophosphatase (non-canonical NTP hydrolase)
MPDLADLTRALVEFRDERDWAQFHNPKDLAAALSIESGELLELFLWKEAGDADQAKVAEELADVLSYSLLLAHHYGLDVHEIVTAKIRTNGERYPVEKARGSALKYDEL